ncbi:MAG: metallophosphoesterase family protein [Colwellia sp.]
MKKIILNVLVMSFSIFLLSACGSGGSKTEAENKDNPPQVSIDGKAAEAQVTVTVNEAEQTGLTFFIDPANYSEAPTIWTWIEGGSKVHDGITYTWDAQEKMTLDSKSGYYTWSLPTEFEAEIVAGAELSFKIDNASTMTRDKSGCYTTGRWYSTIDECKNPPFAPYIGPYLTLITPEFSSSDNTATVLDPASNMIINYEIKNTPSSFEAQASYRKVGSQTWLVKNEENQVKIGSDWGVVHHIILRDLEPGIKYEYKVNSPDGKFSQQYHFTTAKKSMDYSRFLVVGDMQDPKGEDQRWQDVAAAISKDHMDDFDFIVTVGDMVKDDIAENGDRFYFWQVFFELGKDIFAYKPIYPAMGNHDTPGNPNVEGSDDCGSSGSGALRDYCSNAEDTRAFRKYFYINHDMSKPDYYSYSYGNACFMSVNSEIPVFYNRYSNRPNQNHAEQQSQWLSAEVDKAASCEWSFAYWHVPIINPIGTKTGEVPSLRKYLGKFNQKLDWTLTGHVHQYQRIKPVTGNEHSLDFHSVYGRESNEGVGHLTAAPAGQYPRNSTGSEMEQLAYWPGINLGQPYQFAYEVGFTIIQIDGKSFKLETYGLGDVESRKQPTGYFHQDEKKVLLDSLQYSK